MNDSDVDPEATAPSGGKPPAGVRITAKASGQASVYQAGRDLSIRIESQAGSARVLSPADGGSVAACPYPGLAAFSAMNAQWFFGREQVLADLLSVLAEQNGRVGAPPLVLVASSGAGKTSLLQAGLLPALERGALPVPGSRDWPRLCFSPTDHPLAQLAAQLSAAIGMSPEQVSDALARDPARSGALVSDAASTDQVPGSGLAVVIDQFEETFTLCDDESERVAFIDALCGLGTVSPLAEPGVVVLSMRADFYQHACAYPALREALRERQLPMGPLSKGELTQAIAFPCDAVGLQLEPGLVELLIRDLGGTWNAPQGSDSAPGYDAGRLPLLAHALRATWQQRDGHTLTVAGYLATGGIRRAIAMSAERTFGRLSDAQQELTRPLFLRMVKIGDGTEDTRRLVPAAELTQGNQQAQARAVIDAFTEARLLTRERDAIAITHEALLTEWPRLREWIDADRAGRLIRQNLEERAAEWASSGKDASALYRGHRLDAANTWASDPAAALTLTARARAFIDASKRLRRRSARLRAGVIAGATVLAVLASILAIVASVQRRDAIRDRDQAIVNAVAAEAESLIGTNPSLAAQLDAVAYRMRPTPSIYTDLISTETQGLGTPFQLGADAFADMNFDSPRNLLAAGGGHIIRLWSMTNPQKPITLWSLSRSGTPAVDSVTLSPAGDMLLAGFHNGTWRMWSTVHPAHPVPITPFLRVPGISGGTGVDVVFVSRRIVFMEAGRDFQLWNIGRLRTPRMVASFPPPCELANPGSWDVSPNGQLAAAGCYSGAVRLIDIANPAKPHAEGVIKASSDGEPVNVVQFSPNSQILLTAAYQDIAFLLWKVTSPRKPRSLGPGVTGLNGGVQWAAFAPGGQVVAIADQSGTFQLFNIAYPESIDFLGPPMDSDLGPAGNIVFSPNGRTLIGDYGNGTLVAWNIPREWVFANGFDQSEGFAFSPDGRLLAASNNGSGVLDLWEVYEDELTNAEDRPVCPGGVTEQIAFKPQSRVLAVGCDKGSFRLWNLSDPSHLVALTPMIVAGGPSDYVNTESFNRTGTILATGANNRVTLWNASRPTHLKKLASFATKQPRAFTEVSISRDGGTLAVAQNSRIELWDITRPVSPHLLQNLTISPDLETSVAFGVHGVLAVSGVNDNIYLWHPVRPGSLTYDRKPFLLTGNTDTVESVTFNGNGNLLADASYDDDIRLWRITRSGTGRLLGQSLTGHTDDALGVAFSPADHDILASIGFDDTVYLWNLDVNVAISRICATTRGVLTRAAWRAEVGDIPFNPPCSRSG